MNYRLFVYLIILTIANVNFSLADECIKFEKLSKKYAKPSTAYDDFIKCYTQEITAEYNKMNGVEKKDLEKKIKRKYKDDYYYYYKKNYKYGYAE